MDAQLFNGCKTLDKLKKIQIIPEFIYVLFIIPALNA